MNKLQLDLTCLALVGDIIALYFAFHSRRHEKENTSRLLRIEKMVIINSHKGICDMCSKPIVFKDFNVITGEMFWVHANPEDETHRAENIASWKSTEIMI